MPVEIIEVKTAKQLNAFINLPIQLHGKEPNWMPTIYSDDKNFFNPAKNHQFDACETIMALAYRANKLVGRIMGIIHNTYNKINNEEKARFGYLDCIDDNEISIELLSYIEKWAVKNGKKILIGPYGFSDKDVQGLLIEGFEKLPLIDSACNSQYMVKLLENYGFEKEMDFMTYKFDTNIQFPELYHRVYQRVLLRKDIKLIEFTSRKQLKPYIEPVLQLVNRTYKDLYGFVPMSEIEIHELANRYLPIINPQFVKLIERSNKLVAFLIALPNFTKGIQKSKGHIFPIGFIHILRAIRKSKQLDLMLGAVEQEHQGTGLEVALGICLINSAKRAGFETVEAHLILENNYKMRTEMERLLIPIHKKFRVYKKLIQIN